MISSHHWHSFELNGREPWLIVEQSRLRGVVKYLYATEEQPEWYSLYQNTALSTLSEHAPLLIKASTKLLSQWRDDNRWRQNSSLWLSDNEPAEMLISHLQSLLLVNDSKGIPCLFRYFSPQTLTAWGHRLPAHAGHVLGPFNELIWFSQQQWWNQQNTSQNEPFQLSSTRLQLTHEDETALEAITP